MAKKVDVINYIRTLLYDYSSVVVPGLGAFLTQYAPAKINEADGTVLPPVKTVQFNEKLNLNDGLLVSHIARMEKISEQEANVYMAHFVDNIMTKFDYGQSVDLEGIGTLNKTEQGILFTPFADVNFATTTFGLAPVELPVAEVDEGTVPTDLTPPPVSTGLGVETDNYEEAEDDTPVTIVPNEKRSLHDVLSATGNSSLETKAQTDEGVVIPPPPANKPNYLWWLLPVFMLLAFVTLLWLLPGKKNTTDSTVATTDTMNTDTTSGSFTQGTQPDSSNYAATENTSGNNNAGTTTTTTTTTNNTTTPATTGSTEDVRGNAANTNSGNTTGTPTSSRGNATATTNNTNTTATTNTTTASTSDNRGNAATTTANEAPKGYYVVVASYDTQDKADKLASKLNSSATNVYTLPPDKNRYRVGYYCNTESVAQSEMDRLRRAGYPGAWILKRK